MEGAKSGDVARLIAETETGLVSSHESAERARTRALDPALSEAEVADKATYRLKRVF
jgi:hypothetical protein